MSDLKFNSGYRYKESFGKSEFLDSALIYLRDEYLCPPYIFEEAKFSDVNVIEIPIITASGSANVSYSRMLGYDKQIAITTKKTTRYSDGTSRNQYSTRYKTETEWIADNGTIAGFSKSTFIDPKFSEFIDNQDLDNTPIIPLSAEELNTIKIDNEALNALKNDILTNVFSENITYPVNKVKHETYSGEVSINKMELQIVLMYAIEVNVRNKSFVLYSSSIGTPKIIRLGDLPINDDQEEFNKKIYAIADKRDKITKPNRTIRLISILLLPILFIALLAIGINKNILVLRIVAFVPLILLIIIVIILNKKIGKVVKEYGKQMGALYTERDQLLQEERTDAYNRFINNYNEYKQKRVQ